MRFPMNLRWSLYVASKPFPQGGSTTHNGRFRSKIALCLQKFCYKVSFYEKYRRQSCKAFIGLTIRAKMIGGATPSTWNFGLNWPRSSKIGDFRSIFACSRKNSVCPSVCLSVCPSVKHVNCDKTEEKSVKIFIPYERSFSLVSWEKEWLMGATPSTWNFGSTGIKISPDFNTIRKTI